MMILFTNAVPTCRRRQAEVSPEGHDDFARTTIHAFDSLPVPPRDAIAS